jgi:hypothetical protein
LTIVDIKKQSIHGTSYVFVISRDISKRNDRVIEQYLAEEQQINTMTVYEDWAQAIYQVREDYLDLLHLRRGTRMVGYGAAAKGNTFLNFCDWGLEYIIDDNELKQGKFTPGLHIPIRPIKHLEKINQGQAVTFVPLAWNFFDEIKERIKKVRNNPDDRFVRYFPKAELSQ